MPEETVQKQPERAPQSGQPRAQAEKPDEGREEDEEVSVVYHGPSDEFVHGDAQMSRHGGPVRLLRSALDDLRRRFPDHSWSEVEPPRD